MSWRSGIEEVLKGMRYFIALYVLLYIAVVYVLEVSLWLPKLLGMLI